MKKAYLSIFLLLIAFVKVYGDASVEGLNQDTSKVSTLLDEGYNARYTDHEQTVQKGEQALELAKKLGYNNWIAQAYRIMGIGHYYGNESEKAMISYLNALQFYKMAKNVRGEAQVYGNIGNLYRNTDYDLALEYLEKGLKIAENLNDSKLLASAYLNIGNIYERKKNYSLALDYYTKSQLMFFKINDRKNIVNCLQDLGLLYFDLKRYDKAEELLLQANKQAKTLDMNTSIASINLTLTSLYIAKKMYPEAKVYLDEGITYAQLTKDEKLEADFTYTSYQLELNRKNYERALFNLHEIYVRDSAEIKSNITSNLVYLREQHDQQEKQRETELIIERQKNDRVKFWWAVSGSGLLLIVIALLVGNVKRKAKTNARLTELNSEVSRQKDNLDRINHHLEEIIDERTRDLQIKNKKLSEYSSYLSHQIRGPIATLKGLMNLEKEGLVDQQECINMMDKCVSDIDEKIIDMTDILHDPKRTSF